MTESRNGEHSSESACNTFSTIRLFDLPINQTVHSFDKKNLNSWQHQPPAIEHLSIDIE